jgi:hypothetical protein
LTSTLIEMKKPALFSALFLALLLAGNTAWSQPATNSESMPPWTVLALKLVSATHVQPTTGIVIGAPNLVAVGIDFAREGDEIMVLDGGTDIVRHGRPATIVHTLPADKLAILKVQGLSRPAASVSALAESELQSLNLVAFPPAEMIAQGSSPVRSAVKALPAITTSHPTLDPFPNVSGAFTDNCGNLVAFNLSVGLQSMQPSSSPRVAWGDALQRAATQAGSSLKLAPCSAASTVAEPQPQAQSEAQPKGTRPEKTQDAPAQTEPVAAADAEQQLQPESEPESGSGAGASVEQPSGVPATSSEEQPTDQAGTTAEEALEPDTVTHESSSVETSHAAGAETESATESSPALAALVIIGLLLLAGLLWYLHRRRKQTSESDAFKPFIAAGDGPAEPDTVRFAPADAQPAALLLQLTGTTPQGETLVLEAPINSAEWAVEIGRENAGAAQGLVLPHPSISRQHAELRLREGRLVVSDLDSTNGTRLNGVACLPGEVFLVQSGDELQLGDVCCSIVLSAGEEPVQPLP